MADTNAQGLTAAGMGAYAQQRADQAKGEAIAAQSLAGAKMAPQGTVYDVAANNYKDPLTGAVYIGSANTTAQGPGGITQEMKVNPNLVLVVFASSKVRQVSRQTFPLRHHFQRTKSSSLTSV